MLDRQEKLSNAFRTDRCKIAEKFDISLIDAIPPKPDTVGGALRAADRSDADDRFWDHSTAYGLLHITQCVQHA